MIKREIEESIKKINSAFRVLVVTGPRQVGKSTILKSLMPENMKYVTLDDIATREEAKNNPKFFLESLGKPLFIDEIQYAPELFPYIKMEVDNDNSRGQYWLSGSQTFSLMKNVSESLAGRVGIIKMNSFTYKEIIGNTNGILFDPNNIKKSPAIRINDLFEIIFNGGMPEVYDHPEQNREMFYSSYIETYIERDIKDLINAKNKLKFYKFMKSVALRTGESLKYDSIANDVGVSSHTIEEWISILEASRIIYLLEPYSNNKLKRLAKMPKIIFMDSGLASYLSGYESVKDLQLSKEAGHYLESFIVSELIKSYDNLARQLDICYVRYSDNEEIDLIISKNRKLYPLEIKKTATPKKEQLKNFYSFEKDGLELSTGGIICLHEELLLLDENRYAIPISSVINSVE